MALVDASTSRSDVPDGPSASSVNYSNSHGESICKRCSSIPWASLSTTFPDTALFTVDETIKEWDTSTCRVCRLLMATLPSESCIHSRPTLFWCPLNTNGYLRFSFSNHRSVYVCLPKIEALREPLVARYSAYVDFDLIKSWIQECGSGHQPCNTEPQSTLTHFRVIDCERQEIVQAPEHCHFAALSYVWGRSSLPELLRTSSLASNLPRTIKDSIEATKMLGYRYLWVDRLCIDQKTLANQHLQIQQMGAIYSSAQVTIIASAGEDPSYGLPGVSSERQPPSFEEVGPSTLLFDPDSINEIYRSKWKSRAWTYQEGYLSKRRLFFTDREVIYICNESVEYEIGFEGIILGHCNLGGLKEFLPVKEDPFRKVNPFRSAMNMLEEYTERYLSFQSDALNAIVGALNTLETKQPPIRHVFGVPVSHSDSNSPSLAKFALHWTLYATVSRRSGFPSWSPLGWDGNICFEYDQPVVPTDCAINFIKNQQYHSLTSLLNLDSQSFRVITKNLSQYLSITAYTMEFTLEYVTWDPSHPKSVHMNYGFHLILPWAGSYEVCIRPYLHDVTLEFRKRSSMLCAVFLSDIEISIERCPTSFVLVLDSWADHYERVGCFQLNNRGTLNGQTMYRDKDGRPWETDQGAYKKAGGPIPWLRDAKKRTFILG